MTAEFKHAQMNHSFGKDENGSNLKTNAPSKMNVSWMYLSNKPNSNILPVNSAFILINSHNIFSDNWFHRVLKWNWMNECMNESMKRNEISWSITEQNKKGRTSNRGKGVEEIMKQKLGQMTGPNRFVFKWTKTRLTSVSNLYYVV